MTNDRCAICMKADPFMKKDLETVRSMLKLYSGVDIILDRKWQNSKHLLSFAERKEIIDRDMHAAGLSSYRIIPNDTSRYETAAKAGVKNVAIELNCYTTLAEIHEKFNMAKKIIPDLEMIIMPQFDDVLVKSYGFLYELILDDSTNQQYKKYISDYAYMKTKFKLMHKIGLTGNIGCDIQTVMDVFKSRGYETLDVGKMILDALHSEDVFTPALAECQQFGIDITKMSTTCNGKTAVVEENVIRACMHDQKAHDIWMKHVKQHAVKHAYSTILQTTCKTIVMSTTLLYELELDWMFDEVITVMSSVDEMHKMALMIPGMTDERFNQLNAMYIPLQEKRHMSSYYIDASGGKAATTANTIQLIAKRIERCF